ncbi:MAG TPA: 16S rRNA (guanine(527)-N(7))-methyltransferase RsmG [Bacilli bacterium]|nr:MAG: Ribosomal RNA small subunit methyltransferase G [Tenericutes bacterium ADurb.BinA124]HNZ49898.1 16S rRNA (guanine(527)-N(7))-methyltransferase RsmG [Bacilli bacterium]HPX84230.1 16S rRNA (guanine(527)-N(7))-methyltransferase RsmG [Bacilli bacterium]HQC74139.1 16S rRNA (guanine(527)-N(7))-methyltransferase RsmG [Bacilli bacterium]
MLESFNLSKLQQAQFQEYYQFLVSENQKYNLTAITNEQEVYIKHFEDSLAVSKAVDLRKVKTLLDVGSGAGFPGIPLAIVYSHLSVTIVEPTSKKVKFLEQLVRRLSLKNVQLINKRVEELGVEDRNFFDITVARAVAPLAILLELIIPFTKTKGFFLAMKSRQYEQELQASQTALLKLRSEVADVFAYELSENMGRRVIIKVLKKAITAAMYPRRFVQIKQKPL